MNKHSINDKILPCRNGLPVILTVNQFYIMPIFSDEEKYNNAAKWFGFEDAIQNKINDGQKFIEIVLGIKKKLEFFLVVDPYLTAEGNTRFDAIVLDKPEIGGKVVDGDSYLDHRTTL